MKVYQPIAYPDRYDLYFKDKESCNLFSNYYFSFTGTVLSTRETENTHTTTKKANVTKEEYPYTVTNYVMYDIVEEYLALFPEEEDA